MKSLPAFESAIILVTVNAVGLFLLYYSDQEFAEAGLMAIIAINFVFLSLRYIRDRALLLPLLFAVIFSLFHFSLLPIALLDQNYLYNHPYFSLWYFNRFTMPAYYVATTFLGSFAIGAIAFQRPRSPLIGRLDPKTPVPRSNVLLWIFAGLLIYFYLAVFFVLGISNYSEYNEVARGENAGWIARSFVSLYPMIGSMIILCADRVRSLKAFLFLFIPWALIAFGTGLRGLVLFPTAIMLPLLLRRIDMRFRVLPSVVATILLLWFVSFGRIFRSDSDWVRAISEASPVDGLAELGGSLRPVYEVVRWTETGILDFQWGATYWAPIERLAFRILPFADSIPALTDNRLMNVAIVNITGGAYGFSIAAETFINFGYPGAVVLGVVVGAVMAWVGQRFTFGEPGIVPIALAFALFYHIRQSYVGAWGGFIAVATFVSIMIWLDTSARSRLRLVRNPSLK